jgi:hypothetical protein
MKTGIKVTLSTRIPRLNETAVLAAQLPDFLFIQGGEYVEGARFLVRGFLDRGPAHMLGVSVVAQQGDSLDGDS